MSVSSAIFRLMYAIRDMTAADVDAVVTIITSHEETDGELAERYYREYFESEDAESERERSIVATIQETGEIAGVAGWFPDKYDWPGILWLNWFYVRQAHRRRGVGRMLLQEVIDSVRRLDSRKLYLDTSSDPIYARAVELYKRFGFREEGRLADYYDVGEDYLILGLDLAHQSPE